MSTIGQSIPRVEGKRKVTGRVNYVMNMELQGMLHLKLLRSTIPHGKIRQIDTSAVEQLAGVVRVLTGEDLKKLDINLYYGPVFRDQPILAIDKVHYIGEPVAVVIAETADIAAEALQYIEVEYEELEPVLDMMEAVQEGSPIVHEQFKPMGNLANLKTKVKNKPSNVLLHSKLRHGDIEQGFAEADHIFEDVFTTPAAAHLPLEQHVAVAKMEEDGKLHIWTANQSPSFIRSEVAYVLKKPQSQIRVKVPYLGGGFGTKLYVKVEALVAVVAQIVNKPVKLAYTMEEVFLTLTKHATQIKLRTGVTNDGRIVARQCELYWDTGAYADIGPRISQKSGFSAGGPYDIPHVHIDSYCVYTNNVPAGAFRGFGVPQVVWAHESQMDIIAHKMGWDPLEFRRKQVLTEGKVHATGQALTSIGFQEILAELDKSVGWSEFYQNYQKGNLERKGSKIRAKGLAIGLKAVLTPSVSGAVVTMFADGSVSVYCSTVDMGQGSDTVMGQFAAEVLGIPHEKVHLVQPDTDVTPFDTITASSRSTFYMGNAIIKAAEQIKEQILTAAAEKWNVSVDKLQLKDERVSLIDEPEQQMSLPEIFISIFKIPQGSLIGHHVFKAHYQAPDPETGQSEDFAISWFPGGTAIEIEVDIETGKIDILHLVSAADVGKAINPMSVKQQLFGGAIMQVGQALFEECIYEYGQMINANMSDYKVPTFKDIPLKNEALIVEVPHPEGPFGSKGVGETATFGVQPALANALYYATGARIKEMPFHPERVLRAIKDRECGDDAQES